MSSKRQDLIDSLPIPQINLSNQRILVFTKIQTNKYEIEFGEMILGPYFFSGDIEEFIDIYFSQIAKINNYEPKNISKNILFINSKNNNSYIYKIEDINYILNLSKNEF